MREIKFRAWDKQAKEMFDVITINFEKQSLLLSSKNNIGWGSYPRDYELMQFTGLTDKNGKEIYEGDIVKTFSEEGDDIRVVMFKSGKDYQHKLYSAFGLYHKGNWFTWTECVEVLGNIYENPELLES